MAELKIPPHYSGAVNEGEQRAIDFLVANLDEYYTVIPNLELIGHAGGATQSWEFDIILIAPHGIYNIEVKDWAGEVTGNHHYWYLGNQERPNPFKTLFRKNIVLRESLKQQDMSWKRAWVTNIVILTHRNALNNIDGQNGELTFYLDQDLLDFLNDSMTCNTSNPDKIADIEQPIGDFLVGYVKDKRKTTVLDYEIQDILFQGEGVTEYLCKPSRLGVDTLFRVREYSIALNNLSVRERAIEIRKIQHQETALLRIGTHPYIFPVRCFLDANNNYFYEISQYMDEGTLLAMITEKTLTFVQKVEIIKQIAKALATIHKNTIFHRDVSPENIYLKDGVARLGNFGKSFFTGDNGTIDKGYTVYPTLNNLEPTAYMPWELVKEGDVGSYTDLYALGVVMYQLFSGELPFKDCSEFDHLGNKLPEEKHLTKLDKTIPSWVDDLVNSLVLGNSEDRLQSAEEVLTIINDNIGKNTKQEAEEAVIERLNETPELEVGKYLGSYLFIEELGQGGFSTVFKVKHTVEGEIYALKAYNPSVGIESVKDELVALKGLNHPNIVKYVFTERLPNGQHYSLMEYLDGENLKAYTKNGKNLPINLVYKAAQNITDALVYMHNRSEPLLHRDLKPHNIVWDNDERFVLIDFNIAAKLEENQQNVGTSLYLPPDLFVDGVRINWDESADTFGLGVTLYGLLTKQHPFDWKVPRTNQPPKPIDAKALGISKVFADFIMKSVQTKKADRFANAMEMQKALEAIGEENLYQAADFKTADFQMETADFVKELNKLYSQSRFSNAGTRGLDEFAKNTYIKTKLDLKLRPAILDGLYNLVIITGNAGDGKTAFIQQIETDAKQRKALHHGNGARFSIKGLPFESNYDGSQDEGDKRNGDVLKDFFEPFENKKQFTKTDEGRIIAINEGRLVEYLQDKPEHRHLYKILDEYFYSEGTIELPKGLLIVNLNLRSVVADDADVPESIFKKQVKKIVEPKNWKSCENCPVRENCFIRYNAQSLSDKTSGETVIGRMELLLKTIHLRQELHITMRDVRSLISFWITRDHNCSSVKSVLEKADNFTDLLQYYYFNISDSEAEDSGNKDRLIKLIRQTDVGLTALPKEDSSLYFTEMRPADFLYFSEREGSLLESIERNKEIYPPHDIDENDIRQIKGFQRLIRRMQFFEGKQNTYAKRIPYHSVTDFLKYLDTKNEVDRTPVVQNIAKAFALHEGCRNKKLGEDYIILSAGIRDDVSASFRLFPLTDFELLSEDIPSLTDYLEYLPDRLIFRHKKEKHISLLVSLDIYELIFFISKGFSPSLNDLRGRFVELQIFKNLLENLEYKEVVVTEDNREFYKIKATKKQKIVVEKMEVASWQ